MVPAGYYKFGSTPANHWYDFAFDAATGTGARMLADRILLHFVDDGRGDDDPFDGVIRDPGGPAFWTVPVAAADAYQVDEDGTLSVNVLGNDTSPTSGPLTAVLVTGPTHGTLTFNTDGSFNYIPDANFNGTDSITYRAKNGSLESADAVVTITVNPVNDTPVASASGPPDGVRGQVQTFTLGAADPEPEDQAAGFTYRLDWNGDGTVDQVVIGPSGMQVEHIFAQAGSFTMRIVVADQHGAASEPITHSIVITDPPPAVAHVLLNDGHAQRSMVNSITVNFDSRVTIDSGAFELWQQGASKPLKLELLLGEQSDHTLARLTFKSHFVVGGSLPDGNYRLIVRGDKIRDAAGRLLDGDGDGSAGGNRVDEFFRRFGDTDGDDDVDCFDAEVFESTFNKRSHQSGYLWYLDYNANGRIWAEDLALFLLGYFRSARRR
jgi:VCBS repeat-containing protein